MPTLEQVYSGKVKTIASRMLNRKGFSHIDADDITQEVAISVWESSGGFCNTEWVAVNAIKAEKCAKRGGAMGRHELDSQNDPGRTESPLDRLIHSETVGTLSEAIENLPSDLRKVVRMRFFEDKTFSEMAWEMTGNPNSVRGVVVKLKRAIEMLSKELQS